MENGLKTFLRLLSQQINLSVETYRTIKKTYKPTVSWRSGTRASVCTEYTPKCYK
jgi:hypothetical protein